MLGSCLCAYNQVSCDKESKHWPSFFPAHFYFSKYQLLLCKDNAGSLEEKEEGEDSKDRGKAVKNYQNYSQSYPLILVNREHCSGILCTYRERTPEQKWGHSRCAILITILHLILFQFDEKKLKLHCIKSETEGITACEISIYHKEH